MPLNCEQSRIRARGFTLIEILVVMVVIGLMAGIALPRLYDLAHRFEISAQRDKLLLDIGTLGYRAYQTGQAMQLGASGAVPAPGSAIAAPLTVPAGWRIATPQPIQYRFNGICSGGQLTLSNPDGQTETVTLNPPLCLPTGAPDRPNP